MKEAVSVFRPNGDEEQYTFLYSYNENGTLHQFTNQTPDTTYINTYGYDGDRVISIESNIAQFVTFEYENNLISSRLYQSETDIFTEEYIYNTSNQMIQVRQYFEDSLSCTHEYDYSSNNNIITIENECEIRNFEMEYNNIKNPQHLVHSQPYTKAVGISPNLTSSQIITTNPVNNPVSVESTFTYETNEQGYPTRSNSFVGDELRHTIVHTYETIEITD